MVIRRIAQKRTCQTLLRGYSVRSWLLLRLQEQGILPLLGDRILRESLILGSHPFCILFSTVILFIVEIVISVFHLDTVG